MRLRALSTLVLTMLCGAAAADTARASHPGPEGRIAFLGRQPGFDSGNGNADPAICSISPSGGTPRLVALLGAHLYPDHLTAFEWSPDGTRLAYDDPAGAEQNVAVVNADGSGRT